MPIYFHTSKNNCKQDTFKSGYFSDFLLQEIFLNALNTESIHIDPYDGGCCNYSENVEFLNKLSSILKEINLNEDINLGISEEPLDSYYKRGKAYGIDLKPPKYQLLDNLESLIEVVKVASRNKLDVIFIGD